MAREMSERDRIGSKHDVYLGFDVGKSFHWACALKEGEAVVDRPVTNRRDDVRDAIGEAMRNAGDPGVLVTVDQRNNIGSLVVCEARAMGCDVGYLPGLAESQARKMYPRLAKNDRFDAWVIAHTSEASPQALLPVPDSRETRLLGSQRRHCVKLATQARNRLHAILLGGDPEFEAACDLSAPWLLGRLSELGGANGMAGCTKRRYNSACRRHGAPQDDADELRKLAERSVVQGFHPASEDDCVRWLAADISRADAEAGRLKSEASRMLADDECYRCLLTIPGIGPVCAEALVSLVDVSLFKSHDQLASLCGLAPIDSSSGTSIDHTSAARSRELTWLDAHGNVVLAGPPGLGKTMVAVGLGLLAIDEGHAVAFEKTGSLVRVMDDAEVDRKAGFRLRYLCRCQMLIVDEIGYTPITRAQASRFFSLVSDAYERQSLVFTTNKEIPDWAEMVQDPVLATALMDRILHHARCFSLRGESYRLKHPELYAHRD